MVWTVFRLVFWLSILTKNNGISFRIFFISRTAKTQTDCTLNVFNQFRCRCHFFCCCCYCRCCYIVHSNRCCRFENEKWVNLLWSHGDDGVVWRFSSVFSLSFYLSLVYSLVSVTLFIFNITTFYITFIQKFHIWRCVRFLFLYQLFSIRAMDFFVFFFVIA